MKFRKILLSFLAIILLASCNKETEVYEKKDVKVESVFDNIESKDKEEKPLDNKNVKAEDKVNKKDESSNNNAEKVEDINQNEDNANPQANEMVSKEAAVLVNMRETPTTFEDNYILSIPEGNKVEIIEEVYQDGIAWSKIQYQNNIGYVRSDLLR